jgi:hypothetical protein
MILVEGIELGFFARPARPPATPAKSFYAVLVSVSRMVLYLNNIIS